MRAARELAVLVAILGTGCGGQDLGFLVVSSPQEDRLADGSLYSAATQSFGRGHHWLESIDRLHLRWDGAFRCTMTLLGPDTDHHMKLTRLPMDQLVPRLYYVPASPPDAFDAFNLLMAEYARNGVSVPARVNGLDAAFVREALAWRTGPGPLELGRFRTVEAELASVPAHLVSQDQPVGFSTYNRDAIGARLILDDRQLYVHRIGDGSFLSNRRQDPIFGLGEGTARRLVIHWPDRERTVTQHELGGLARGTLVVERRGSETSTEWLPQQQEEG